MKLFELNKQRQTAVAELDRIVTAAETGKRDLTEDESIKFENAQRLVRSLDVDIRKLSSQNTLSALFQNGKLIPACAGSLPSGVMGAAPRVFDNEYFADFHEWVGSRGQKVSAALYEGSGPAGGYTVPIIVEGQVVPLAPQEMGVRAIANVIPTASDIKIPRATAFGTAAGKAESGASDNFFTESDPTLDQFTLSAFMAGISHTISWELAQDVPSFQQFAVTDLVLALQMYEENLFVNGTGTGQAQGVLGNTGAGVTGVLVGSDNYASELLAATFDVLGKLNVAYFNQNTRWLLNRATATVIRKAQMASNLFVPVFTSQGGKDYLHGIEVAYSASMPNIGAGNTPVLFGDFKQGYIIGDRGGSGINVKILDQPKATEGQLILLAYRRTDGRVRRSEAIQAITLHA